MAEVAASRIGKPIRKGASRLAQEHEAKTLTVITDAKFRKIVRERDKMLCRRCGRRTRITIELDPLRAEVHHIHGRLGNLRHEDRCALLLCLSCHSKCTGVVDEKWIIVGTKFVEIDGHPRVDARAKVKFERVA